LKLLLVGWYRQVVRKFTGSLARQQAHERNQRIGRRRWAALRRYWLSAAHSDRLIQVGRLVTMAKSLSLLS
jgi:hypothetical protein